MVLKSSKNIIRQRSNERKTLRMQIELQKQIVRLPKEKKQKDKKTLMLLKDKQKPMLKGRQKRQKQLKMLELQKNKRNKKNYNRKQKPIVLLKNKKPNKQNKKKYLLMEEDMKIMLPMLLIK